MIRVSAGTANVLGLKKLTTDAPPTTAYLMSGEKCSHDCAFCPQARNSTGRSDLLSRVTWPDYDENTVVSEIGRSFACNRLKRTCLQVVSRRDSLDKAKNFLTKLKQNTAVPVCISCNLSTPEEAGELFALGADRVGLALDAACERVYQKVKAGSFTKHLRLIEETARLYPGRISTHLIAGLGETEEEMVTIMAYMVSLGVTIGLFAFTPVKGTRLENGQPPDIASYRRIQLAQYLLANKLVDRKDIKFHGGKIIEFGLPRKQLAAVAKTGKPFQTSGCPDCNRPYYNEKPGGVIYNYPRPLTPEEIDAALRELGFTAGDTACSGD